MSLRFSDTKRFSFGTSDSTPTASTTDFDIPKPHCNGSLRAPLSQREQQVLELLARGRSNKEIGRCLFVSEDTVKYHLKNLYGKLGSRRRTEAILSGYLAGLLDRPSFG